VDDANAKGAFEALIAREESRQTQATGWAALVAKGRPADAVVLAYETPEQSWTAFALSEAIVRRRDVARSLRDKGQAWAGWTATFPRGAVPPGARVSAWALDADGPKLYRLEQRAEATAR